ncbi:MAG: paraquat-inducible protein A [Acidobacteria bacterium]|nr:paraquat-inducible protein A [Acidobacteriota bacterium]
MTISCADCGSFQVLPDLPPRGVAECFRCDRVLARAHRAGVALPMACAIAVLVLIPAGAFLPLMQSTFRNLLFEESRLISSVGVIYTEVWFPFAFGFLFFAFLFPAIRAILQILVLGSILSGWRVPVRGRLFRWSEELRPWSMPDVVVIAGLIAYYRAEVASEVDVMIGGWTYLFAAFMASATDLSLDRRSVWNAIHPDLATYPDREMPSCDVCELVVSWRRHGDPCPRCGEILASHVLPRFIAAVTAVAATIPLLLPAFLFSVMVNDQLTGVLEHTVLGTVQMLADRGYWQFGVVVLLAGIVIPLVVLVVLIVLIVRVRFPERGGLVIRTRLYRLIHRLMRWPMILPFIAAIAAPIIDYQGIDDIVAGPGATPLFMVIALIMLAVQVLEPRLMWKTAGVER